MDPITELLKSFGFETQAAKTLTEQARGNGLTLRDVNDWLIEARKSTTLYNPRGFVRSRLRVGARVPTLANRITAEIERNRWQGWGICQHCQTWPCLCLWDPDQETLAEFRTRTSLLYDRGTIDD